MQDGQEHKVKKVKSSKFGSVWVPHVLAMRMSILILNPVVIKYWRYWCFENSRVVSTRKYVLILAKISVFKYEYAMRTQP